VFLLYGPASSLLSVAAALRVFMHDLREAEVDDKVACTVPTIISV
jgi:hypothetical protein